MSLTKYKNTHYKFHALRFFWLIFLIGGLFTIQVAYSLQTNQDLRVLAYSTNVNRADLHRYNNAERAANGLPGLQLSSVLNQAAQGKAEHMIANNYWAHTAPDGTTPWYWFDWAGYNYLRAGENLAYGFADSYGVTQGWMNSPGHRANILGDYRDIGFGYASGPNYQGGQNTVVVAMYGTSQQSPPPPAAPAPVAATPPPSENTPPSPPAPVPAESSQPVEETQETPLSPEVPAAVEENNTKPVENPEAPTADKDISGTLASTEKKLTSVEQALSGTAAWPLYASLAVIVISTVGFSLTHVKLIHYGWSNGFKFAAHHPMIDVAVVSSVALFFFSTTIGYIR